MESALRALPYVLLGAVGLWMLFGLAVWLSGRAHAPREHIYDKVAHYVQLAPAHDPIRAYVPVGFLLGWLIERGLTSDEIASVAPARLRQFHLGSLTAPELYEHLDGVLTSDMLSEPANQFLRLYLRGWPSKGLFVADLAALFGRDSIGGFAIANTAENYHLVCTGIDRRWKTTAGAV